MYGLCDMQVVQEYERAVIFRLGRLLPGGAKGPGQPKYYTRRDGHISFTHSLCFRYDFFVFFSVYM